MSNNLMSVVNLPPGPRSALPQLLHLKDPFPLMDQLAQDFSDPITLPLLGQSPMVLTWSEAGARAVFSAPPETFSPGAPEALASIVGKGSIFLMSGDRHRRARKLLMPPFQGERVRSYGPLIREASLRWLRKQPTDRARPVLPLSQGITLDVIIEAVFGEREPTKLALLEQQILGVVEAFHPLVATFSFLQKDFGGIGPWAKLQKRIRALRSTVSSLIAEKRRAPKEDILSLLLSAKDEDGEGLSEQDIYEQLMTFVVAGHETTATTLAWALYEIHRAPGLLMKLKEELGSKSAGESTSERPLIAATVAETLRRHPPVPIVPRKLTQDFELGPYRIPAGHSLGVGVYMLGHNKTDYPKPFEFQPARFLNKRPSPFLYAPFGGGARRCLGAAFASYELEVALSTLLEHAEFELAEPKPVRSVFRIGTFGPETGIVMKVQSTVHESARDA